MICPFWLAAQEEPDTTSDSATTESDQVVIQQDLPIKLVSLFVMARMWSQLKLLPNSHYAFHNLVPPYSKVVSINEPVLLVDGVGYNPRIYNH